MKKIIFTLFLIFLGGISAVNLYSWRKELRIYWIEWSSFVRYLGWQDNHFGLRKPFLSKSISKQDPEAAAIVEWMLHEDRSDFRDIEYLSEMAICFPENQYFLYDLTCTIATKGYTDPQIVDFLANRLLELDGDNGRYYLLKAWAAFYDWREDRVETTLTYLERCFAGRQQDPFVLYKSRVSALIAKEKCSVSLFRQPDYWLSNDLSLRRKLIEDLLEHTQDLIVNGRADEAMQIHDRLQRIAEISIPQTIQVPWQFWISFHPASYSLIPSTPQSVELKWMHLTPERAKQNRMQMLGWKNLIERVNAMRPDGKQQSHMDYRGFVLYLVPFGAHCFEMTVASSVIFTVLIVTGLILKMQKSHVPFYAWIIATMLFAAYFALCRFGDYELMHLCCGRHYTYDCELIPTNLWDVLAVMKTYPWVAGILFFITGASSIAAIWFYRCKPTRLRFSGLHAAVVLLIFLVFLKCSRLNYSVPVFHLLVLWLVIPLICLWHRHKDKPFAGLFSHTDEGAQLRWRCVMVAGYLLMLHLAGFGLLGRSTLIKVSAAMEERNQYNWPVFTPPRYETSPQQYSDLLHHFNTAPLSDIDLQNLLPMVEPEDIAPILTNIKHRRQNDPNYGRFFEMMQPAISGISAKPKRYLPELAFVMEQCGKDAQSAIIPFLEETDSRLMLIIRGRAGDLSVHDPLVTLWKQYRDAGFPSDDITTPTVNESESFVQRVPLESLVSICPYSEFKEYVLETARNTGVENGYFVLDRGIIPHFSREQKGDLVSELLAINNDKLLSPNTLMELLHQNFAMDSAVKENLWKQVIAYGDRSLEWKIRYFNVTEKPFDYMIPDELLEQCMSSKDESLRAMGQHIYRVMQRPPDRQTIEQWANDTNFSIRADSALISPDFAPSDDPDSFVKLVHKLAKVR